MISSIALAGAFGAGTLGASLKAYREQKRKKEMPWTAYAEKVERRRRKRLVGSPVAQARARFDQFCESQLSPVVSFINLKKNKRTPATNAGYFLRSRQLFDRNQ